MCAKNAKIDKHYNCHTVFSRAGTKRSAADTIRIPYRPCRYDNFFYYFCQNLTVITLKWPWTGPQFHYFRCEPVVLYNGNNIQSFTWVIVNKILIGKKWGAFWTPSWSSTACLHNSMLVSQSTDTDEHFVLLSWSPHLNHSQTVTLL